MTKCFFYQGCLAYKIVSYEKSFFLKNRREVPKFQACIFHVSGQAMTVIPDKLCCETLPFSGIYNWGYRGGECGIWLARAFRLEIPIMGTSRAWHKPLAVESPTLRPVKLPGPIATTRAFKS
jgi:hypothetical protein